MLFKNAAHGALLASLVPPNTVIIAAVFATATVASTVTLAHIAVQGVRQSQ